MDERDAIFCLQHCEKGVNVLWRTFPKRCPLCGCDLQSTQLRIPPFRLTVPFQRADQAPCSIVIRPTVGSFLRDYTNSDNLHVGITNTKGIVFDYDADGLHYNSSQWTECLAIPVISPSDQSWACVWNARLGEFAMQKEWTAQRYHEEKHNCYDFVLGFLCYAGLEKQYPWIRNRSEFCAKMIIPKTSKAAKYISTFRRLETEGVIVQSAT